MREKDVQIPEITASELFDKMKFDSNLVLIDVRMASFFNTRYGHIKNAKSYPILKMMKSIEELGNSYKDKEVITMCYGGGLSLSAADFLLQSGFKDVKSLKEGTDNWAKLKYPTVITEDL